MLRVLIVDDDARVRRALRSLIESAPDLTVVGEAASARSSRQLDQQLLPDVVILDLLLPHASDGIDVLRELRRRNRPVVAVSVMPELGPEAMAAGACAFLEKDGQASDTLLNIVRAAHDHSYRPPTE
jgi:DNA-binding NarL/FixJ family response regulator